MIYACEACGFLFQRTGEISECPSCDNTHIRPATDAEAQKLTNTIVRAVAKDKIDKEK